MLSMHGSMVHINIKHSLVAESGGPMRSWRRGRNAPRRDPSTCVHVVSFEPAAVGGFFFFPLLLLRLLLRCARCGGVCGSAWVCGEGDF